jgi:hypothetical protein
MERKINIITEEDIKIVKLINLNPFIEHLLQIFMLYFVCKVVALILSSEFVILSNALLSCTKGGSKNQIKKKTTEKIEKLISAARKFSLRKFFI